MWASPEKCIAEKARTEFESRAGWDSCPLNASSLSSTETMQPASVRLAGFEAAEMSSFCRHYPPHVGALATGSTQSHTLSPRAWRKVDFLSLWSSLKNLEEELRLGYFGSPGTYTRSQNWSLGGER